MKVITGGIEFNFTDAVNAFVFDETDPSKPTFHGAPMKAVDVIAELQEAYIFIEVKDFNEPEYYDIRGRKPISIQDMTLENPILLSDPHANFKWLKNYLKYKYRDSFLYRYAEGKVDKPVHYICLLSLETGLNISVAKALQKELPVVPPQTKRGHVRWTRNIVESCTVLNIEKWNKEYPKWPAKKLPPEIQVR